MFPEEHARSVTSDVRKDRTADKGQYAPRPIFRCKHQHHERTHDKQVPERKDSRACVPNETVSTAGVCGRARCNASFDDCDGVAANGCEARIDSAAHCGRCGNACTASMLCTAGACAPSCTGGTTLCGESCVDTRTSATDCGRCGNACPSAPNASPSCAASACDIVTPAANPGGEIVLECDRDKGEIYIRPVGDSAKPVNLFISSAQATYTLVLRRSDTPADTIVIRDKSLRFGPSGTGTPSNPQGMTGPSGPSGPSANHIRTMKAMLVAMASDRVPPDIRVDEVNRPMQLWAEARFALMRRYEGRGLLGEKYLLQNVSQTVMVVAEQEFDRPDSKAGGQVVGVAVENHNLRPGESTNVFVIRRGGER